MKNTIIPLASLLAGSLFYTSCAINQATGERQFILISESREIEMGREADEWITAQMGLYDDDALAAFVEEVGRRLQGVAERPNLPWTFRLVDDPVVNAFALPGGFVYITRGILAHLNNEAQLAAVMGHEIGHITGRHGAEQLSRAQVAQIGLGVGSMISPTAAQISGVAEGALGLLFLRYSRDDERQSDDLALRYLSAASYDAREMPDVFTMLGRVTAAAGVEGTPSWLSTHPDPGDRHDRITGAIAATGTSWEGTDVGTDRYLDLIDGMAYGSDPRNGYFDNSRFLHTNREFTIDFPDGWTVSNQTQAVAAVSSDENAIIRLTISGGNSPGAAARNFIADDNIQGTSNRTTVGGFNANRVDFTAEAEDGSILSGRALFVLFDGSVYSIVGYGTTAGWSDHRSEIRRSLNSFARLTDPEVLAVQPMRIAVARSPRTQSLGEYLAGNPAPVDDETIALLNQLQLGDILRSGTKIKTVVAGSPPIRRNSPAPGKGP